MSNIGDGYDFDSLAPGMPLDVYLLQVELGNDKCFFEMVRMPKSYSLSEKVSHVGKLILHAAQLHKVKPLSVFAMCLREEDADRLWRLDNPNADYVNEFAECGKKLKHGDGSFTLSLYDHNSPLGIQAPKRNSNQSN